MWEGCYRVGTPHKGATVKEGAIYFVDTMASGSFWHELCSDDFLKDKSAILEGDSPFSQSHLGTDGSSHVNSCQIFQVKDRLNASFKWAQLNSPSLIIYSRCLYEGPLLVKPAVDSKSLLTTQKGLQAEGSEREM